MSMEVEPKVYFIVEELLETLKTTKDIVSPPTDLSRMKDGQLSAHEFLEKHSNGERKREKERQRGGGG